MKTTMKALLIVLLFAGYTSCKNSPGKTITPEASRTPDGRKKPRVFTFDKDCNLGNLVISTAESDTMIKNYFKYYSDIHPNKSRLAQQVWIDSAVIGAFAKLFESGKYDGVRFIYAVKDQQSVSTVIMVPTIFKKNPGADHSQHENAFDSIHPSIKTEYQDFNLSKGTTDTWQENFHIMFQNEIAHNETFFMSSSVWVQRCVIESLNEMIHDPEDNLDGVRVWMAAYSDSRYQTAEQQAKHQTTIILVPTFPRKNSHLDDWEVIPSPIGAYNHGQLCPKICP